MFIYGIGLLGSIFLSFGCLIAALNSLATLRTAYDKESRLTAVMGFIGGIVLSVIFGLATILILFRIPGIDQLLGE